MAKQKMRRCENKILLGYRCGYISDQLLKIGRVVEPHQVTEEDVKLIHNLNSEQLRKNLNRERW